MKTGKSWAISVLLFASAIPVYGHTGSGGPKSWLHFRRGASASSHYRDNRPVVKHQAAKHPKPHHARNPHR